MQNLTYALLIGTLGVAAMSVLLALVKAAIAATEIEAILLSLPFG